MSAWILYVALAVGVSLCFGAAIAATYLIRKGIHED